MASSSEVVPGRFLAMALNAWSLKIEERRHATSPGFGHTPHA
jgi:hypothetical protein